MHQSCQKPDEDTEDYTVGWVFAVSLADPHRNVVYSQVALHNGEDDNDQLEILKSLRLVSFPESNLILIVSLFLLTNSLVDKDAQDDKGNC